MATSGNESLVRLLGVCWQQLIIPRIRAATADRDSEVVVVQLSDEQLL